MKMKSAAIAIACAAWVAATPLVFAAEQSAEQPQEKPPQPSQFLLHPRALERINLTDEQKANYTAIEKEYLKKRSEFNIDESAVRKAYQARREAEQSGDPAKIEQARRQFESIRDEYTKRAQPLIALHNEYVRRFFQYLTPEQAKIIDSKGRFSGQQESPTPAPRP
jgi:Spy/CpxP family protein refolding chaperone